MTERVKILGCGVDKISFYDAIRTFEKGQIVTINPEMIEMASRNANFARIINNAELVIPDGIGVELGLRILGHKIRRIPGIEFGMTLMKKFANDDKSVALVGAKAVVLKRTIENLKAELPHLYICYSHDGYFVDDSLIIDALVEAKPDLVLVALGSPKQEFFISQLKEKLPNAVMIGLGGSFDVWAGVVDRAPKIWQKLGLEWLYRTIREPKRLKRIFPTLPLFVLKVLKERLFPSMLTDIDIAELQKLALENRQNILRMVYLAQSGHIGGSLSACELLTVLFHKCMKHSTKDSDNYDQRDRFVLSKGHISPLYYSVLSQVGFLEKEELDSFRKLGSRLQGHPALMAPGVEVATGSLGQGLSVACGIALSLKLDNNPANVFVMLGDGEIQEGNVWEAFMQAPVRKLDNLVAIIDRNRLQIDGNTEEIKPLDDLASKLEAFNWEVIEIDGHNIPAIYNAYERAKTIKRPVAIIANTVKGKGVSFMENNAGWHGKAPSQGDYERAMAELGA